MTTPPKPLPSSVIDEVLEIAQALREAGVQAQTFRQQPVDFWRHPHIERRIRQVANIVVALNPEMLSQDHVTSLIHWPILVNLIDGRLYDSRETEVEPRDFIHQNLQPLTIYSATTDIEVPVLHCLSLRGESFTWGPVTFKGVNPWSDLGDYEDLKLLIEHYDGRLNGMASVSCPGDPSRAWAYLNDAIAAAHRELVGAAWPRHGGSGFVPPSVLGMGPDASFTPLFEGGRHRALSFRTASGHAPFRVPRDLEEEWGEVDFSRLTDIAKRDSRQRTEVENNTLSALRWLGAATEPDIPSMKVVKVATALESLLGDPGPDANVSSRGVTATLAERCAFLVGTTAAEKQQVHDQVVHLYDLRSRVLHQNATIDPDEFANHGLTVWTACRKLTALSADLKTRVDLRRWTLARRYE